MGISAVTMSIEAIISKISSKEVCVCVWGGGLVNREAAIIRGNLV